MYSQIFFLTHWKPTQQLSLCLLNIPIIAPSSDSPIFGNYFKICFQKRIILVRSILMCLHVLSLELSFLKYNLIWRIICNVLNIISFAYERYNTCD